MDPKKSYKVIVFIDGNNFYYKMKDMTSMKTEVVKLLDFKYNDFSQNLIKGDTLIEIRYYVGSVKRQAGPDKQKSEKLYANQQKLIAKLQQQTFEQIRDGLKSIETRLNDEKRQSLKVGDEIEFCLNSDKSQRIDVKVLDLIKLASFEELLDTFSASDFGAKDKNDFLIRVRKIYTKEEEEKSGVLGIKIQVIP